MDLFSQTVEEPGVMVGNNQPLHQQNPNICMPTAAVGSPIGMVNNASMASAEMARVIAGQVVNSVSTSSALSSPADLSQGSSSWYRVLPHQNQVTPPGVHKTEAGGCDVGHEAPVSHMMLNHQPQQTQQQQQQPQLQPQQQQSQDEHQTVFVLKRDADSTEKSIGQYIIKSPAGSDMSGYIIKSPTGGLSQYVVKKPENDASSKIKAKSGLPIKGLRPSGLPASIQVLTEEMQETFHSYKELSDCHLRMGFTSQCQICDKSFGHWRGLQRHLKRHANFRPYTCKVCNMKFHCQDKMRRHEDTHIGLKPHKCPVCNIGLSRREHLKRHLLIHSETKPFECSICGYSGKRVDNVRKHIKSKHEEGTASVVVAAHGSSQLPCSQQSTNTPCNADSSTLSTNQLFTPVSVNTNHLGNVGDSSVKVAGLNTGLPVFPGFVAADEDSSDLSLSVTEESETNSQPENDSLSSSESLGIKSKHKRKPSKPVKSAPDLP